MTESRQEGIDNKAEAELRYWERQHRVWEDEGGAVIDKDDNVSNEFDKYKFDETQLRPLAHKLAGIDARVGRRVLEGPISLDNIEDRNRLVQTEGTQQSDFVGGNLTSPRQS